uniref:E3 ubiquitin-protein ligase TRIM9 n=1 Tax=Strongyloides stercoralis TaxID=6248 RepID=A0A913HJN2_STRER
MDEELKCPGCHSYFTDPILLNCGHSYCRECALKANFKSAVSPCFSNSSSAGSDSASVCTSELDHDLMDKLSLGSETDSGVGLFNKSSRPNSFISNPPSKFPSILTPSTSSGYVVTCNSCQKANIFIDENCIKNAPTNKILSKLVERKKSIQLSSNDIPKKAPNCQLCEDGPMEALVYCEQCDIYYCSPCQNLLHPSRGPLMKHTLIPANKRSETINNNILQSLIHCESHSQEALTMYCTSCKVPICCQCLNDSKHSSHEVQSLSTIVKSQKGELSKILTSLSEKAKIATEDIGKLKQHHEYVNQCSDEVKKKIEKQINDVINKLEEKKLNLFQIVEKERKSIRARLKDQITKCSQHLSKTTALIQYCIEILKENDSLSFMEISQPISNRTANHDFLWDKDMKSKLEFDPEIVLNLNTSQLEHSINNLNFAQKKVQNNRIDINEADHFISSRQVPNQPEFIPNECSAENNSFTIVWGLKDQSISIDGYILEIALIDKDKKEKFREVYRGPESSCSIYGLHFNTFYQARVKAFNCCGVGSPSEHITLQTAPVPWFNLEKNDYQQEVVLSKNQMTVTGSTLDYNVVLGSVYFSKGTHYWEIIIDNLSINADVVVGVGFFNTNRNAMLGRDLFSWSMYIDNERSWYLHNDKHHGRIAGGIGKGSVIGVLLNCDIGTLSFIVNRKPLIFENETFAFKNMPKGLYYPAISVNCNSKVTVKSGLSPPVYGVELTESCL